MDYSKRRGKLNDCKAFCESKNCASLAIGTNECFLYTTVLSKNFRSDPSSPYTFYDAECFVQKILSSLVLETSSQSSDIAKTLSQGATSVGISATATSFSTSVSIDKNIPTSSRELLSSDMEIASSTHASTETLSSGLATASPASSVVPESSLAVTGFGSALSTSLGSVSAYSVAPASVSPFLPSISAESSFISIEPLPASSASRSTSLPLEAVSSGETTRTALMSLTSSGLTPSLAYTPASFSVASFQTSSWTSSSISLSSSPIPSSVPSSELATQIVSSSAQASSSPSKTAALDMTSVAAASSSNVYLSTDLHYSGSSSGYTHGNDMAIASTLTSIVSRSLSASATNILSTPDSSTSITSPRSSTVSAYPGGSMCGKRSEIYFLADHL